MNEILPNQPPSTARIPAGALIARAVKLQCPNCGYAPIWNSLLSMKDECPNCGYVFAREHGYFLGGYALNLIVAEGITMLCLIALLIWTDWEWWVIELIVIPMAIVLPILFFRHARGFWMALDFVLHPQNQR